MKQFSITSNVVDVIANEIRPAKVTILGKQIVQIEAADPSDATGFMIPPFVDSHIHIESSMLLPSQFARAAVVHGTVATVSDPHEIANVCGTAGIALMLHDAAQSPFKFYFGAPACVPATTFETSGATIDAEEVANLLDDSRIIYLSEMMDFPGVLARRPDVMAKIKSAIDRGKRIDGHAPGLRNEHAKQYFTTGITTDHECSSLDEAIDKLDIGCRIAIREGSAARNYEALKSLINRNPDEVMFCSDDKHPDELLLGHVDRLAARAVADGADLMNVLKATSVNAVRHYGLDVGLLQIGDPADFVLVSDLSAFKVESTYIDGQCVAEKGRCLIPESSQERINRFGAVPIRIEDLRVPARGKQIRVIEAIDGELITRSSVRPAHVFDGYAVPSVDEDMLKLVVVNRYCPALPCVAFVSGFGMKRGAIASSVAHDSHNVIAVGCDDESLVQAINSVIESSGGLVVVDGGKTELLHLPVAGLMSTESCQVVGQSYRKLDAMAKQAGCHMRAPFMALSFLALLVIPSLKLSDRGLFDVDKFEFVDLFVD